MEYVIAVFSVRTETLMFNQYLHRLKINSTVMNTPKQAHTSCGICVKFPLMMFGTVKRVSLNGYRSFVGFYKVTNTRVGTIVSPIKYW